MPALQVIYLDNHLLVINKPPGVLVQGDRTGDIDLLTLGKDYLKARFDKPGNVFLGLVHRLDRTASGVMVFARTSKAAARLSEQFRTRTTEKDYIAIVAGILTGGGDAETYLKLDHRSVRIVQEGQEGAMKAQMSWRAMGHEDDLTLVAVRLKTGRKHQIRAQLAAMGHPILGDFRFKGRRELDGRNIALHAYHLGFEHPTSKEWLSFTTPPPESWGGRFSREIERLISEVQV